MSIAFPSALILLLFAFSTQHHLTLAKLVKDIHGHPLVPGDLYQILDNADHTRGIEVGQTKEGGCPASVIIGIDAKKVIIHPTNHAQSIKVGESVRFKFKEVDPCAAASPFWHVSIPGGKQYPVVIGPRNSTKTLRGEFRIIEADGDGPYAYYIAFRLGGVDDYVLMESAPEKSRDIYRLVLCPEDKRYKNFSVAFKPRHNPSPPPPSPSPPPPPPKSRAPTSTFVPLIRKIVR